MAGALVALLLAGCGPAETRFTAEATLAGGLVEARGETAIPDGAQLNLSLEPAAGGDALAVALPKVQGGRWQARLDPRRALPPGGYVVRAMFSPRAFAWSEAVRPFVGADGEKLGGPNVKQGDGYRYLEIVRPLTVE